ncbi:MAG: M14 family zinc carboxypeptidase [Bacteroidales bacterium]
MKKIIYLFLFSNLLPFITNGQEINEYYFKFKIESKSEIEKITQLISIDNVKDNYVFAYANQSEMAVFEKLGYNIEFLQKDIPKSIIMADSIHEMANWNRYPTYEVYQQMMRNFQLNYPSICKLDSIGTSIQGRQLYVVKISDNVTSDETEPEFFYTSTMHGDEATGYVLMLRFIDSLLTGYGSNSEIDKLINSIEIYINPNANPDGTYRGGNSTVTSATRYNANNEDLNRDYPDPRKGLNNPPQEPENQAMMNFASSRHFVMSANFHGGAEVMNYPWDTWTTSQNPHADVNWFKKICTDYVNSARKVKPTYMTDTYSSGITEGGDWYVITGGRQDYMNYWHHCREVTVELSSTKLLGVENLDYYWRINRQSLINYLKECAYGFHGTVKNSAGNPLKGAISIENHDQLNDSSIVYSDATIGDFHRPIDTGIYTVVCSVVGYTPLKVKNIPVNLNSTIQIDFVIDYFSLAAIPNSVSDSLSNTENLVEHSIVLHNTGLEANNYTLSIENALENPWLTINKTSGIINLASSDTIKATLAKGTLQPGAYSTNLIISETDGDFYFIPIGIFIPDTSLLINPLSIDDSLNIYETSVHKISIYNSGTVSNNYSVSIENTNENTWISCNKLSGSINSLKTDSIEITLTNNYLVSGDYSTLITITESDNDTYAIPVNLNIPVYPDTSIAVNPTTIYDTLEISENSIKEIILYNSGTGQNIYSISFENNEEPSWINLSKQKDTIQSLHSDTILVYLSNNSLSAGDYSCNINITEQDSDMYIVNVNLNVPSFKDTSLAVTPTEIFDTLNISENSIKEIILYNSGTGQNIYSISFENYEEPSWINLSKQKDTIQSEQSDTILVYLSNNSLSAGDYSCNINITEQDSDIYVVNVNLNVPVVDQIIINKSQKFIQLFPNPFSDHLGIELEIDKPGNIIIQLYDITGCLVEQKTFVSSDAGNRYYNLSNLHKLTSGQYILRIISNNRIFATPIIKNQ